MTLRIFEELSGAEAVISLHGRLEAAEVPELRRLAESKPRRLRIDLSQLTGLDAAGVRALQGLRDRGARLSGASRYVELLLEGPTEAPAPADKPKEDEEWLS